MKKFIAPTVIALALSGCAGMKLAKEKAELSVNTTVSKSVFLTPVKPSERTVLVQIRNQSSQADFEFATRVRTAIVQRGYLLVEDPAQANYILQANLLSLTESKKSASDTKDSLAGAVVGGAAGSAVGKGDGKTVGVALGAIAGALATNAFNNDKLDVSFAGIVDVKLQERNPSGQKSDDRLDYSTDGNWIQHTTRVNVTATKVNLKFAEAREKISNGIAQSLAGLF